MKESIISEHCSEEIILYEIQKRLEKEYGVPWILHTDDFRSTVNIYFGEAEIFLGTFDTRDYIQINEDGDEYIDSTFLEEDIIKICLGHCKDRQYEMSQIAKKLKEKKEKRFKMGEETTYHLKKLQQNDTKHIYEIETDFETFVEYVKQGRNAKEKLQIFMMCYMATPSVDELNTWTLQKLLDYIEKTNEYYDKDKRYIDACVKEITKEE
jgi:hypothetical protein